MTRRVGIELSPTACRIVELDGSSAWGPRSAGRVRSFAVLPASGTETRAYLASLRRRQAAVVVWGGRTEHRQVMVTAGSYESMRAEAMTALSAAGVQTNGMWADIALASPADNAATRRPVVVSMASASDTLDALQPLREAGIRLRTVTTPAVVLASLARLRAPAPALDAIESYVAFDETTTCITLVRRGVLLAARDLPWGFVDADYSRSEPRSRDDIVARLAEAIEEFVEAIGGSTTDIGQVSVCGGLPDLRSMAVPLMERLDVEVEPLDGLFAIDAARLPEPADEFRERSAELRLAWAAAADWPPIINLLRARRRQASKTWLARAAVLAGAAAGVAGSWLVVERSHLWPGPQTARRAPSTAAARGSGPAQATPARPPVRTTPPPAVLSKAPVVPAPPVAVSPAARPSVVNQAPRLTSQPAQVDKPLVPPPPAVAPPRPPVVAPRVETVVPRPAVVAPPPAAARPAPLPTPAAPLPTPRVMAERSSVTRPRPTPPPKPAPTSRPEAAAVADAAGSAPEAVLPFDAVLGTILYSPERKLAIIDNRIVGIGDEVRGARVVSITAAAVTLRDAQGRLRRLTLGAGSR